MNPALIFALAVLGVVIVGGAVVIGDGSLRCGVRRISGHLAGELAQLLVLAVFVAAALLMAVLADGGAWTFIAIAASVSVVVVIILLVPHRRCH